MRTWRRRERGIKRPRAWARPMPLGGCVLLPTARAFPENACPGLDPGQEEAMPGHDVYLVGSVPMADAEQVFGAVSAALGRRVKRIPDGETGERGDWITWLEPVFADHPAF